MDKRVIMKPIQKDLKAFTKELDSFVDLLSNDKVKENYRTFFKSKGKHIRPSLLFMSVGAVAKGQEEKKDDGQSLYKLGLVLELLHSASLIHDDIIDEDDYRRGSKTVNSVFGNKVGVLAGDTLFSYAFALATSLFTPQMNKLITNLALEMCMAELLQANGVESVEEYFTVIKGKTALFMSVSCELGGLYSGAKEGECLALREFGMNLGMTYQIIDDFNDKDPNALKYIRKSEAKIYYNKAVTALGQLEKSPYTESLLGLLDYVMKMK